MKVYALYVYAAECYAVRLCSEEVIDTRVLSRTQPVQPSQLVTWI